MPRTPLRLLTVAGAAAAAVGLTALPALAHVSVSSPGATQGGYGVVTFRVPTESDTASTGLKIQLPTDTPLAYVGVKPKPGWTYTVTKAKLAQPVKTDDGEITEAPSVVEWKSAAGDQGIKPGEFDEFELQVGPMPKKDSVSFKSIQTYSDNKVVSWIEEPAAGSSEEPEFPAPTLKLAAATADADGGTSAEATTNGDGTTTAAASDDGASKGSVTGAYVVGGVGLLAGLAALGLALTRRRATTTGDAR